MPTERFYHLVEEKKRAIREAAIQEFCRVPLEKASINKIVKNAQISRGSFYTYFQDKEDVLGYIFEDIISQVQKFCIEFLSQEKGDFWKLPRALLEYTIHICETNKMFALSQAALGNRTVIQLLHRKTDSMMGGLGCPFRRKKDGKGSEKEQIERADDGLQVIEQLYQLTDCSKLKVNNLEEFQILFSLCIVNMVMAIGEIYQRGEEKEEAVKSFEKRMGFIQHGAAKSFI